MIFKKFFILIVLLFFSTSDAMAIKILEDIGKTLDKAVKKGAEEILKDVEKKEKEKEKTEDKETQKPAESKPVPKKEAKPKPVEKPEPPKQEVVEPKPVEKPEPPKQEVVEPKPVEKPEPQKAKTFDPLNFEDLLGGAMELRGEAIELKSKKKYDFILDVPSIEQGVIFLGDAKSKDLTGAIIRLSASTFGDGTDYLIFITIKAIKEKFTTTEMFDLEIKANGIKPTIEKLPWYTILYPENGKLILKFVEQTTGNKPEEFEITNPTLIRKKIDFRDPTAKYELSFRMECFWNYMKEKETITASVSNKTGIKVKAILVEMWVNQLGAGRKQAVNSKETNVSESIIAIDYGKPVVGKYIYDFQNKKVKHKFGYAGDNFSNSDFEETKCK